MNRYTVLLIEDNLMNMELASDLLEGAKFNVLKSEQAEEGIAMALALQPDLILMDIALPGMDGLEATKILKKDDRTAWIPVVALTASVMRGDDNRARSAGCCGYISKPIDTRQFIKTVTSFIEVKEVLPANGRKRVLVVDDEKPNRELLEAILTGLGHDVDLASDGFEAIAKLNETHDLILLDVMMAGIDGFEVVRRIRKESKFSDVPICMVTALSGKEERLRAVESGANDFVAKPIDKMELLIRTASLLKIKDAQDTIKKCQATLEAQNRALLENYDLLKKAGELKDEFVRIASHDLKNPLTCIMGFAALLESETQPGVTMTGEAHDKIRRIITSTKNMTKIIKDFLDFQILEDGELNYLPKPINLNDIALIYCEQNSAYAERKRITVQVELDEELPLILADESQVGQVIDNLLGNAIKFGMPDNLVTIRTIYSEGFATFEVCDNGAGISEEDLPLLFVKYARLNNKPTGDEKSSGLGLAICKKLIELNGGQIGGRNNNGLGATFWFKLPVTAA